MRRVAVLAALGVFAGCGGSDGASSPAPARAATTKSHIVVLVMENKEYGQVIGSRSAPYLTSLARRYVDATNFHGIRHPSLPNYLALVGGATFGVRSDCTNCIVGSCGLSRPFSPPTARLPSAKSRLHTSLAPPAAALRPTPQV